MGLKTPIVDGARQELPHLASPVIDGARQEVAGVEKLVDGAWQEVWPATKVFRLLSRTMTTGSMGCGVLESSHDGKNGVVYISDANGTAEVVFVVDGQFTNPVLECMHSSWFFHRNVGSYVPGGVLSAYGIRADGTAQIVGTINSAAVEVPQQFSYAFSGEFVSVGFRMQTSNYGVTSFEPLYYWDVFDVKIDGKKCIFNEADSYG